MKVSIITATYNSMASIEDVYLSISNQTYSDIEWIVIDGNSIDGTVKYIDKINFKSMSWISEPDNGIYDALNKGVKKATGDIIGFLHSDDFFENNLVIEKIVGIFEQENPDGVYGDLKYVHADEKSKVIRYWKSDVFHQNLLKKGWMPAHPTLFLKKDVYEKHGDFDLTYKIAADYDFILRIMKDSELKFFYLPQVITNMRMGGASNALSNIVRKMKEDLKAIRSNNVGGMLVLIRKNLSKIPQFISAQ